MVWALNDAPVTNTTALVVLVGLANHAGKDGTTAFPSAKTLAMYARCSERTVMTHLKALEEAGIIRRGDQSIVATFIKRWDRRPILYDLNMALTSDGVQNLQVAGNGVHLTSERGANDGAPVADKPSLEPSINQTLLVDRAFESLWITYPRKVGKAAARKTFDKIFKAKDAPSLEVLIDAAKAYGATVTDLKYCAHLTTWLNGQRWADETVSVATPPLVMTVEIPPHLLNAIGIGISHARAGYTEQQVIDATERLTEPERQAAIEAYRERRPTSRGSRTMKVAL